MIEKINNREYADQCDELLTKLILDERQYDDSIDSDFVVKNYFNNFINDDKKILYGYFKDNILVGYIYAYEMISNNIKGYFIDGLYVLEEYRNNGIGNELINEVISYAEGREAKFIEINVLNQNVNAINLYKKCNFNEFKITMRRDMTN